MIGTKPWAARIAAATVHIHEPAGLGDKSGTGFVVRDSAPGGRGHLRIVTAGHVVDDILADGGLLEVASASGVRMGYAEVVDRPAPSRGRAADGRTLVRGDLAVIEMRGFFSGGEQAFDAIEGIDLGRTLPAGQMEGLFSKPSGIVAGASGSPVIDASGRVVAILIGSVTDGKGVDGDPLWSASVRFEAPNAMWYGRWLSPEGETRPVTFPSRSLSFAETLADRGVLGALGRAGALAAGDSLVPGYRNVTVPGYPAQVCVAYRGDMYPAGKVPGVAAPAP